jgi:hypothetical protein
MTELYAMLNVIPSQCTRSLLVDCHHGIISDGNKINILVILVIFISDTDITIPLPLLRFLLSLG